MVPLGDLEDLAFVLVVPFIDERSACDDELDGCDVGSDETRATNDGYVHLHIHIVVDGTVRLKRRVFSPFCSSVVGLPVTERQRLCCVNERQERHVSRFLPGSQGVELLTV